MKVRYNKGMGCPVEISDGKTATCISLDTAKKLQASLLAVIEQAEMPEEEMSEFEKALEVFLMNADSSEETFHEEVKKHAAELLSLARDQFIKDGYVIEKKAFHDAVEKIDDKHKAEMSIEYSLHCRVENGTLHAVMNWEAFQKVAQKFIDIGKAEALKDLPRWRKLNNIHEGLPYRSLVLYGMDGRKWEIADKGKQIGVLAMYISIGDLKELPKDYSGELPGFKEDEK